MRQIEHARSGVVFGRAFAVWWRDGPKTTPDPCPAPDPFRRLHQEIPGRVLITYSEVFRRLWIIQGVIVST
jgi:hypothetical protein